jgi:hypothetical protein
MLLTVYQNAQFTAIAQPSTFPAVEQPAGKAPSPSLSSNPGLPHQRLPIRRTESPTKASGCEGNKKFCLSNNLESGGHE